MTISATALAAVTLFACLFVSEVVADSSSCPSNALSSSQAVSYAQQVVDGCIGMVDSSLGRKYTDGVTKCMKSVLAGNTEQIAKLKCPQSSAVTAILSKPVGACGKKNSPKAENVSGRRQVEDNKPAAEHAAPLAVQGTAVKQTVRCQGCHDSDKSSGPVSRARSSELVLQTSVRGCCCDYCRQFGGGDRQWCYYFCCGSFGGCCC
jgi:hypothetical protein